MLSTEGDVKLLYEFAPKKLSTVHVSRQNVVVGVIGREGNNRMSKPVIFFNCTVPYICPLNELIIREHNYPAITVVDGCTIDITKATTFSRYYAPWEIVGKQG
jgi:hypothetical protein